MVSIRLQRMGKRASPTYRVVVIEHSKRRSGRQIEVVGFYNPMTNPPTITVQKDRIDHWVKLGAQTSIAVSHLMK